MSDVSASTGESEPVSAPIDIVTTTNDPSTTYSSPMSAGKALAELRWSKHKEQQKAAEAPVEGEPEAPQELADEANAESPVTETAAQEEVGEPAEPAIDPPKSWTKDARERWAKLDRETQQLLLDRDREDQTAIKRAFNEAAEQRKAIESERQKAEQVRQQYEAALPMLMRTLQDAQAGAFADVKTVDDVTNLATNDPLRYLQWQAHQTKMQAVQQEMQKARDRQAQDHDSTWRNFVKKENDLFTEKVPEFADKKKAAELTSKAVDVLHETGFADQELSELASGQKSISIYDHRFQLLLLDGIKYREAQKAKQTMTAKPVPPVQKPGIASNRNAAVSEEIASLQTKLAETGSLKVAQQLRAAQLAAQARRRPG